MPNSQTPLEVLGGLTADVFLRDYWQKKPLIIRQAFPNFITPLASDELAGLSLEEELESRIIIEHGETPWQLKHGPFTETTFAELPASHWTLLVQAVDQFIPEVQEILQHFNFLPSWRIDDVMISFATEGGSVGPHYDNYDVFLLQTEGHRRWKVGQFCDHSSPLLAHDSLRLLAHFEQSEEWVLAPGDMLYLPPCLAHWGIAEDNCQTWSVGFRAPSAAEVLTHYTDYLTRFIPDEDRFSDSNRSPLTDSAEIRAEDLAQVKRLLTEHLSDDRLLLSWFGQFMTDPKYPERVQGIEIDLDSLLEALQQGALLVRNPSARLAWSQITLEGETGLLFFVSGNSRLLSAELAQLLTLLCSADALHLANLAPWLESEEATTLIVELVKQGSLEFADE